MVQVSAASPVVILVEDERQIRRFVRTALEAEGWTVVETDTLRQGLTDAGTHKPDLIILDLGLPDGNGMELIHQVRGWSSVPIIVLSARVDEHDKIEALDAGADDYLTKPPLDACRRRAARGARFFASATSRSISICAPSSSARPRSISRPSNIAC